MFFDLQTGFQRLTTVEPGAEPFLRATTKLIVMLYALTLGLSLGLVALDRSWVTVVFVVLSLAVVAALVEWTVRSRGVSRGFRRVVRVRPWWAWLFVLVPLAVPWALDGWHLGRESLAWALLIGGVMAFANTVDLVLLAFDLAAIERDARIGHAAAGDPDRP